MQLDFCLTTSFDLVSLLAQRAKGPGSGADVIPAAVPFFSAISLSEPLAKISVDEA